MAFQLAKHPEKRKFSELDSAEINELICSNISREEGLYYRSLDMCNEAEGCLTDDERLIYAGYLRGMISRRQPEDTPWARIEVLYLRATPMERCEAMLAIKGLILNE